MTDTANTSHTSLTHKKLLELFGKHLDNENFETRLMPATAEIPYDTLLVRIDANDVNPDGWQLELSFIPNMEDQLDGVALMQCFAALPGEVKKEAQDTLNHMVVKLNTMMPMVGFGVIENHRMACFRNVLALPDDGNAAVQLMLQAIWMIAYLLDLFGPPVAAVAAGSKTISQALENNPYAYLFG